MSTRKRVPAAAPRRERSRTSARPRGADHRQTILTALAGWLERTERLPVVRVLEGRKPANSPPAFFMEVPRLIVVRADPALDAQALLAFCRERLAAYKMPRSVEFVDELPKSNVGKILRRVARERHGA